LQQGNGKDKVFKDSHWNDSPHLEHGGACAKQHAKQDGSQTALSALKEEEDGNDYLNKESADSGDAAAKARRSSCQRLCTRQKPIDDKGQKLERFQFSPAKKTFDGTLIKKKQTAQNKWAPVNPKRCN